MYRITGFVLLALVALEHSGSAQSNCKDAKGDAVVVAVGGGPASGPITNGGDLNGTVTQVFTSAAFPTPDPSIVSFAGDLTITTNQGQLKASVVNLFDFSNGVGTSQARINPAISKGRFAGATGFLFFNGLATSSSPFTDYLEITGQICYGSN